MAISSSSTTSAATLARRQARAILAESRFHSAPIPRPLHGVLHDLGTILESPLNAIEELVGRIGAHTPGGSGVVWVVLALIVVAIGAFLALRGSRRALSAVGGGGIGIGAAVQLTAVDLEREADAAEAEQRHADAVRWRFRAGLMRLAEKDLVAGAPSMVNAEVSRALRSGRFDALARRFDEITYGGRAAVAEDAESSRRDWSRLLDPGRGR